MIAAAAVAVGALTPDQFLIAIWPAIPAIVFRALLYAATIRDVFSRRQRMNPR
jgi:hypothetical protein